MRRTLKEKGINAEDAEKKTRKLGAALIYVFFVFAKISNCKKESRTYPSLCIIYEI